MDRKNGRGAAIFLSILCLGGVLTLLSQGASEADARLRSSDLQSRERSALERALPMAIDSVGGAERREGSADRPTRLILR